MRFVAIASVILCLPGASLSHRDQTKYSIKEVKTPAPKELQEPIRNLLSDQAIQLLNESGAVVCEVWMCKTVPVKATPEQVQNGLTYREVEQSTLFGAIKYSQQSADYRKQKINAGVYTLRLGFQPMDGDHMGTAPYPDFCLLLPAGVDKKPDLLEVKELRESSGQAVGGSHPGVLLLYPSEKAEANPKLEDKGNETWVLTLSQPVTVEGKKAEKGLGVGLTLVGHTTME